MLYGQLLLNDEVFAGNVEVARGLFERLRGLLGRAEMPRDSAMLIEHCASVHTIGMRFALDLIFLDRNWRVVKIRRGVRTGMPVVCGGMKACRVVESACAALDLDRLSCGDRLVLLCKVQSM